MSGKCCVCEGEIRPWLNMPIDPKKNERSALDTFFRCPDCGLGAAVPLPSPAEVSEFYNLNSYYTQGESHIPKVQGSLADKVLSKLAYWGDKGEEIDVHTFPTPNSEATFLDVGCGGGSLLKAFSRNGYKAFGLEPDKTAASFALTDENIRVFQGTSEDIPQGLSNKKFDVIAMTHVLEHCINPMVAIKNIKALLKPQGVFWLEVPNAGCKHFERFNVCSEMFDAPRHIYFFDDRSLRAILETNGLMIERTYYRGFQRHHSPDWRTWECAIHDMVMSNDPSAQVKRHDYMASSVLLAKTIFSPAREKYDCVGMMCRAA